MAVDEIAERVRALEAYAIGGLGTFAKVAKMKEFAAPPSQGASVRSLIGANEKLVADAEVARDLACRADDPESQDMMIALITLHQKTIRMLPSFLKG